LGWRERSRVLAVELDDGRDKHGEMNAKDPLGETNMNRTTKETGTSNTSNTTQSPFNNIAEKMEHASERIRAGIPNEGRIHDAAEVVAQRVEDAGAYLREADFRGLMRDTGQLIKKHPVPFVAMGLGLGFFLARRRRR
jgi:hypothetical protein